jgi:hypothetical protein
MIECLAVVVVVVIVAVVVVADGLGSGECVNVSSLVSWFVWLNPFCLQQQGQSSAWLVDPGSQARLNGISAF